MTSGKKALYIIEEITYFTLLIFAVTTYCGATSYWSHAQSKIVMVASCSAIVGILCVPIVEKILKIKFSIFVDICIAVDLILSIILGEASNVYYRVQNYDKFLHFMGTLQFAVLGYSLSKFFLRETNKGSHQLFFSLMFGFFFAVAIEAMWEVYEFSFDSLCGTNMQKYIPDEFISCVDEKGNYTCSDEEIAAFYATKEGHQFAVMDTMYDIICDTCGSLTGILICGLIFKFKPSLQDEIIYRPSKEEASLSQLEPSSPLSKAISEAKTANNVINTQNDINKPSESRK